MVMKELQAVEIEPGEDINAALRSVGEYGFVRLRPGAYYATGMLGMQRGQSIIGRRAGNQHLAIVFTDGVQFLGPDCVFINVTPVKLDGSALEMAKEGV